MKKSKLLLIFFLLFLLESCISHERKMKSQKYILKAEELIRTNLSYTAKPNEQNRKVYVKALSYLNKAISLDSLNIRAYVDKQTVLANLGKEIDTTIIQNIIKLKPDFAEEYLMLGRAYEGFNKPQSAKKAYNKAKSIYLEKPSSDARNLNLVTIEFLITNDKKEAIEKVKIYPIQNPKIKNQIIPMINEIKNFRNEK